MSTYRTYLKTLRRIPDDAILDMAAREIDPWGSTTCIVARAWQGLSGDFSHCTTVSVHGDLSAAFGGTPDEWSRVDFGENSARELAFTIRVMEAVEAST